MHLICIPFFVTLIAAAGKLGAIAGVYIFVSITNSFCDGECDDGESDLKKENGIRLSFGICGLFGILGLFWSRWFIPLNHETASTEERTISGSSRMAAT